MDELLDSDASAIDVLRQVVKLGSLVPGYSVRNGKTTIYGGQPAICFTEMPIYNIAKYAQSRADEHSVSAYGIGLLKRELYQAGGRPVIYGLSSEDAPMLVDLPDCRLLDESVLPFAEQYRYVAYDPTRRPYSLDWTHEREWRWVAKEGEEKHSVVYPNPIGWWKTVPGLPLFAGKEYNGYFTQVVVIVRASGEAEKIADMLQFFQDYGGNDYSMMYGQDVSTRIVMLDRVIEEVEENANIRAQRIEDLPDSAIFTVPLPSPTPSILQEVEAAVERARQVLTSEAALAEAPVHTDPSFGVSIITYHSCSEVTRALLQLKLASPDVGRHYFMDSLAHDIFEVPVSRRQQAAQIAADTLTNALGQRFFVEDWDD